jgi:hypothetical protein
MADRYERPGWIVARHLQVALPRELSPEGRLALAHDIGDVTVGRFPHTWAVHEPQARDDSGLQPHVPMLFSPRREDLELDRTPAQWFAKAAARDQDPLRGGVRKDVHVERKAWLYDVRAAVALRTNAALAREGIETAVDHRSLEARGLSRDPARYGRRHDTADLTRTMDYRQQLCDAGALAYEQLATSAGWRGQAVKLVSLDRAYLRALCRDHVWRSDQSPAREQERQQSMERTFDRAMERRKPDRQRERTPTRQHDRTPARSHTPVRQHLRSLAAELARDDDMPQGAALRVRLHDRDHEQDHGRGW